VVIDDGAAHDVDSSEQAFKTAAIMGFREAFAKAKPVCMEPIMKVETRAPVEFQGTVVGQLNQRRGMIEETSNADGYVTVVCAVPLAAMFGYSTDLRSATQGKGEFTMEFLRYSTMPRNEQDIVIAEQAERLKQQAAAR
jgi:elongation factor G